MKASEARKKVKQANARKNAAANKAQKEFEIERQRYIKLSTTEYKTYLKDIKAEICKAASVSESTASGLIRIENAEHGLAYLNAVGAELEKKLTKDGYKFEYAVEDSYGNIFDGSMMNPEIIGSEYGATYLRWTAEW